MPLSTLANSCRFSLGLALVLACLASQAVAVSTSLTLSPASSNANRLSFTIDSFGLSETATSDISGAIASQLELDVSPSGVTVTGLRFDGGQIDATDLDFEFGSLFTLATIEGRNLGGNLVTIGPGFSTVSGGQFPTEDHLLIIDQGTLAIESILADESFNLAEDPVELVDEGIASVALQQTGSSGALHTYLATMMLPVDATTEVEEGSITATIHVVGNLVATGSFQVDVGPPGDFNDDGTVDAADYTVWRDALAQGQASVSDYQLWRSHYGETLAPAAAFSSPSAAPEPNLVGWALVLGLLGVRRKK